MERTVGTAWRDAPAAAERASREYAAVWAGFAEACAIVREVRRAAERRERAAREAMIGVGERAGTQYQSFFK